MVDDQPAKLLAYEAMLEELGENLIKANTRAKRSAQLLQDDVAVVLMDVSMPEIDGFELAAMIRQHPGASGPRSSSFPRFTCRTSDRVKGYETGAVDYVSVPVVPEILAGEDPGVHRTPSQDRRTEAAERRTRGACANAYQRSRSVAAALAGKRDPASAARRGARGGRSAQGCVSCDACARAAQSACADSQRRRTAAPKRQHRRVNWSGFANIVDRQVTHLVRLVDDLLDASQNQPRQDDADAQGRRVEPT